MFPSFGAVPMAVIRTIGRIGGVTVRGSPEFSRQKESLLGVSGQLPQHVVRRQVPSDDQSRREEEEKGADVLQSLFPRFDPAVSMFRTQLTIDSILTMNKEEESFFS